MFEEALAPAAHGRPDRPESLGDLVVAQTIGREDHDLGPEDLASSGRLATRPALQFGPLLGRQLDQKGAPSRHPSLRSEES